MIRWITNRLGTAAWQNVQGVSEFALLDVRDLVDKAGNFTETVRRKIDEGTTQLKQGAQLVVCCDYGMSRSNAIAAGILAVTTPMPFDAAVREVCRSTGETAISVDVLTAVRSALQVENDPRDDKPDRRCVLVTGASGSIGAALVRRMPAEWRLLKPDRGELDLSAGSIVLDGLIREHNVDTVVHLANPRIVTTNQSLGESLVLLKNVLDACRVNDTRLVFLSCWEVFAGNRSTGMLVDEQTPVCPAGTYSQAKYLAELLIQDFRAKFDKECSIVRASPVYGENCSKPRFIANYIEKALMGNVISTHRYRNGLPHLDLLHVDDLAEAIVAIIREGTSDLFHVGPEINESTTEIAEWIVEFTRSRSQIEHRDIDGYAPNVILDASLVRRRFGWRPRIDWRAGLQRIVETFMAHSDVKKRGAA